MRWAGWLAAAVAVGAAIYYRRQTSDYRYWYDEQVAHTVELTGKLYVATGTTWETWETRDDGYVGPRVRGVWDALIAAGEEGSQEGGGEEATS